MKLFVAILGIIFIFSAQGKEGVKYQTAFGRCPSESTGKLTLLLVDHFEKNHSLQELKELFIKDKLKQKYFLSSYKLNYNPVKNFLNLKFQCPRPLMKVQVYKDSGVENYEAILVEGGELFDPTYEVLLRAEKKLKYPLPFFALPVEELNSDLKKRIAELMSVLDIKFSSKIAEVIFTDSKELTVIMSLNGRSCTAFLGKKKWTIKMKKLRDIIIYMLKRKKIPVTINITNLQKPVAKFSK